MGERLKIYKYSGDAPPQGAGFLLKFHVLLPDKPGALAGFSSLIAESRGNISYFHYDRAMAPGRVAVEVQFAREEELKELLSSIKEKNYSFEESRSTREEVEITGTENILEIKVRLRNIPGTLAAFSRLLAFHSANVIYMLYDEDIDMESADIAMATRGPSEVDDLLNAINIQGYSYRVIYKGSDEEKIEHMIGLKQVEKFFLRLKKILSDTDIEELKNLVDSSQELNRDLVEFYSEAGKHLEAGDVFEKVLTLASKSRSSTGGRFSFREMPPLLFGGVKIYSFGLPTSENLFVLTDGRETCLIDTGYGVYFQDIKKLLSARSIDPASIKRIFLTHADADHAGGAGFFEAEFGARVFIHPASIEVIKHENRAYGLEAGKLFNLNKFYTRLINKFTDCRFPEKPVYFNTSSKGKIGEFEIIDNFLIGGLSFLVLESKGGHISGGVFFLEPENGLLFTSDYMINVKNLSPDLKEHLGVYRYLLTNPNRNSGLYRSETEALSSMIKGIDNKLRAKRRSAIVFPGHGDYYSPEISE